MSTNAPLVTGLQKSLEPSDPREMDGLRARLVQQADAAGLLDLSYSTVDSPIGRLLLAASPAGLVRVAFEREDHDAVVARLATDISPRILHAPRRTDMVARELDEYFAGTRRQFDVAVDLQLVHGFRRAVIEHLSHIAYRAVGSACAHNPVPVVVPCHRVIRSDGTIGQYLGGVEAKAALLALEGAA